MDNEDQGGNSTLARPSLGDRIFIAAREGNHFDVGEHAVFDVDRGDVAVVVGVDEEDAAAVPEVLAVFFAGFYVQFQSLSSHCLILTLSVSMNITKAGTKGMSAAQFRDRSNLFQCSNSGFGSNYNLRR